MLMFLQSPEGTGRQSMGEHGQTGGSTTEEEILLQVTTHTHIWVKSLRFMYHHQNLNSM